jgi:hypothetical protein
MLLPAQINRIKGKNLLGQILPDLIKNMKVSAKEASEIQDQYLLSPPWSEIVMNQSFSRSKYQSFCDARFAVFRELILTNLGLEIKSN